MRFINHKNSNLVLFNGINDTIKLKPGDVSKSFLATPKMVFQFIRLGDSTELAIVREGPQDDKILSQCPQADRYVYNNVDDALTHITVFHRSENEQGITGESLNEVKELKLQVNELNDTINQKDLMISNLNKSIDSLTEDKNYLNSKIETLNKEYQGYKSQVTIQITDLNRKLESSNEQEKGLKTTINNLLSEKIKLEDNIKNLTEQLANNKTKLEEVDNDNGDKDQAINGLMNQIKDLENSKTILEANNIKLKEEITSLKTSINEKDILVENSKTFSEEIIALKKALQEKSDQLDKVVEDDAAAKNMWNSVCKKFDITFDGTDWKCGYKGNE